MRFCEFRAEATRFGPQSKTSRDVVTANNQRQSYENYHHDAPLAPELLQAHERCTRSTPAGILPKSRHPATKEESLLLDRVLRQEIHLDAPPSFLKQILNPMEIALFHEEMRKGYGYLRVATKPHFHLHDKMSSVALARYFFHPNNADPINIQCNELRKDINACWLQDDRRNLIIRFNAASKAAKWKNTELPYKGHRVLLEPHFLHPDDNMTEQEQRSHFYSFRLLHVDPRVATSTILRLMADLNVQVASVDQAYNPAIKRKDPNSWMIVTTSTVVPPALKQKTCIAVADASMFIHHFQQRGNMPCRTCFSLEHQDDVCNDSPPIRGNLIEFPRREILGDLHPSANQAGSYAEWRQLATALMPAPATATQTELIQLAMQQPLKRTQLPSTQRYNHGQVHRRV